VAFSRELPDAPSLSATNQTRTLDRAFWFTTGVYGASVAGDAISTWASRTSTCPHEGAVVGLHGTHPLVLPAPLWEERTHLPSAMKPPLNKGPPIACILHAQRCGPHLKSRGVLTCERTASHPKTGLLIPSLTTASGVALKLEEFCNSRHETRGRLRPVTLLTPTRFPTLQTLKRGVLEKA
jgi:hypothetical protein